MKFKLFGKKEPVIIINDKIWMTADAKFRGLLEAWKNDQATVFICWFDETYRNLSAFFSKETDQTITIYMAREAGANRLHDQPIIFAEHFPLSQKENEIYLRLGLNAVTIYSSLDEPLFTRFGGQKIGELMKKLGMPENESIENNMISNAIKNAQGKIAKKLVYEQAANYQADLFLKNSPR